MSAEGRNPNNWSILLSNSEDHEMPEVKAAITSNVKSLVAEKKVVVLGRRGCFMSYVMERLFVGIGVIPAVYEVEEKDEAAVVEEVVQQLPVVYVGGRLVGGLERLMAAHITGELESQLKDAGC